VTAAGRTLEVRGLSRTFRGDDGALRAVDSVDLVAGAGEVVSLIGPSGCGKSTVCNIVAGLDEPTAGEVRIDGRVAADRLGASAYMPQRDALLAWRRVIDNVALPLQLRGMGRGAARDVARPQLERFGLGGFARAWPWQLSGGMRQRAAFLRTVITEPGLMLLDEPFGALDGITRADLQEWLGAVRAEHGATVLLVTHDVSEAVFLSDRVYVMTPRPGRIAAEVVVDLPHPRRAADRERDDFAHLERTLRQHLRAAAWPAPR
jgi:putative hydroxymethylpyrimidine transport system ATP-binding protein